MNKTKLFNILDMSTFKLMDYLHSAIRRKYYDLYSDHDNYIFAVPKKLSNHVMLVAHIDTVKRSKKVVLHENNGVVSNLNGVLGADDRAGVYAILEIVEKCIKANQPLPYILFTNYEECGGLGVKQFCKDKIAVNVEADIWLMIELDRRGVNDAVYYSEPEAEVKTIVESVGYDEAWGSYSDVSTLSNHNDIAHVNLSIGYFNEHSSKEILVLSVVDYAIENVLTIMPMVKRQYNIEFEKVRGYSWSKAGWGDYYDYNGFGKGGRTYGKTTSTATTTVAKDKKKDGAITLYDKGAAQNPLVLVGEDDEYYAAMPKSCPNCMEWEEVREFKSLGYNYCEACGTHFDNEWNVIVWEQADDEALAMLEMMEEYGIVEE